MANCMHAVQWRFEQYFCIIRILQPTVIYNTNGTLSANFIHRKQENQSLPPRCGGGGTSSVNTDNSMAAAVRVEANLSGNICFNYADRMQIAMYAGIFFLNYILVDFMKF